MPIFVIPNEKNGAIAQLVEQRTENPCVPSSILGGTTQNPFQQCCEGFGYYIPLIIVSKLLHLSKHNNLSFAERNNCF